MDELKTCAHCGSGAHVYDDGAGDLDSVPAWIAACDDEVGCGCVTAFFDTREEAVAAWNRRAERTCRMAVDEASCMKTCSECGASYGIFVQTPHGCKAPSYCPNCGARIIKEEP